MRRFRKLIVFVGACAIALVISVYNRGDSLTVGANAPLRAAVNSPAAAYDLSQLPIFTRSLFHVRESYFDKNRLNPKRMLVGALDFLQRDVPEILIDRGLNGIPRTLRCESTARKRCFLSMAWTLLGAFAASCRRSSSSSNQTCTLWRQVKRAAVWLRLNLPPPMACFTPSTRTRCCWMSKASKTCV